MVWYVRGARADRPSKKQEQPRSMRCYAMMLCYALCDGTDHRPAMRKDDSNLFIYLFIYFFDLIHHEQRARLV